MNFNKSLEDPVLIILNGDCLFELREVKAGTAWSVLGLNSYCLSIIFCFFLFRFTDYIEYFGEFVERELKMHSQTNVDEIVSENISDVIRVVLLESFFDIQALAL